MESPFITQPVVQLQDVSSNNVNTSGINVVATIASGTGVLGGTTTIATNGSGMAVYTDLFITGTAGNYTLKFTPESLSSCTSNTFTLNNPSPSISTISHSTKCTGGSDFTLTVNGSNFIASSVVKIDGSARTTTFVNSGQLTATILASDIATASTPLITVTNPSPGGGTSGGSPLYVTQVNITPTVCSANLLQRWKYYACSKRCKLPLTRSIGPIFLA